MKQEFKKVDRFGELRRFFLQRILHALVKELLAGSVLGLLNLYRCVPREHIRVFLSSSTEQMDVMLSRANQGLLSTAITVDQLWDKHSMSWIEIRRLEVELGAGYDHDHPYTWSLPPSGPQVLAWTKLRALRERGEFES